MLTEELRNKLIEMIRKDPKEAIKELEKDPKVIEILLSNDSELKRTREELTKANNEKIKYINMTSQMQIRLEEQARRLNTTQGMLIGAGVIMLLSLLDRD